MNNTKKETIAKTSLQTLAYNISVTQQFSLGRTILTVFSASENDPENPHTNLYVKQRFSL